MNKYLKYILLLLAVAGGTYGIHHFVLEGRGSQQYWVQSGYSLLSLYFFGFIASFFVTIVVLLGQWTMPKNVGFIFLGVMTVKVIASYLFIQDGLNKSENDFIEYNFLVVFLVFLFSDVFVAFKVINEG
ncbi:hypothetical protein FAZ15_09080 [Sphingobacterium olei]|uniref:Uncharacterized protein n=1 Tax=Sphingobacterium olei TaxID=2571155 RepID=A0A4U0P222_9SPHI|nr:hypothetical protein [Sphingobacterium olei]TJZ61337.1 hypothetical protein FAZ15_09080 [Sphingobacterium olei]